VYLDAESLVPDDRVAHVHGVGAASDVAATILEAVVALDPAYFDSKT